MSESRTRIVAGCMTGTSLDGLDVALVRIIGTGLEMQAGLLAHHAMPFDHALRSTLISLALGEANEPLAYLRAARALGEMHAEALSQLIAQAGGNAVDFVAAHGQTICHAPKNKDSNGAGMSWQLFDPWPIVQRLNIPVCYDLRQADLIAGGEGAPLTPIADWVLYRKHADVVANLGGILNITALDADPAKITGGDVYPCNLLLDGLCQRRFEQPYDTDGDHAGRGTVTPHCVHVISQAIEEACADQTSLGREQFGPSWFDALLDKLGTDARPEDVLHSAARLVAFQLGGVFPDRKNPPKRLVLAGGGVKNRTLVKLVQDQSFYEPIVASDDLGIPCEAREAMAFAVLGALSQDGVPIALPQVTGANTPGVAGVWAYI